MGQKPHGSEDITAKLREIGVLVGQGMLVTKAIKHVRISESTYYRWRANLRVQAGQDRRDPDPGQAQIVRRLETENNRLRRALADLMIEKQALREAACDTS